MAENIITIDHLSKSYGRHLALDQLSLTVEKGEIFGFLGSNGAGKSTTIRCLLGLIKYRKGKVTLFNDRYHSLEESLDHIGYMPSEAMFYPNMTVKQVIDFAAKAHPNHDCKREADRLCKLLEVPLQKKIQDLSLGNRKKVSIVCALQHQPDLLILDEPTSGLDPLMQERFFQIILDAKEKGKTCFLSSHVLSEVKAYCDRVAILKKGKLLAVDRVENIMHSQKKQVTIWKDGQSITKTFDGKLSDLLSDLSEIKPDDLLIEEPSLEDLFMHYYKEDVK
ncbi:ABC transporter ATP-binding protein [Streptococcus uberis]|uniref:ABC transporter ATP-binding protein n=1 Tax=Streptococcus uberis TaxID=1349 RepID=UPI000DA38E5F|nr:ABC transporter ATP-binding protein [Streptococcus uberis]MCK1157314.1 ABC transporter ATP-binding protein [Streptococcus uberis]MCK1196483.1 ABC transporter ATP-binding protein [Streptococcus uberis]MCK1220394.1 ABC transporter ATP-binding protein [Streptococcus uberis]MCK1224070.1 ABC transporter ATP-binding protein [Streptococcus uberis]MTB43968.1 ATP-binding cassette domain-containing protein [Streptococcus uberis]